MPETARRRRAVVVAVSVLIIGSVVYLATASPLFAAKDIRVDGTSNLRPEQVIHLAQVGDGANLLLLSDGAVTARLLQSPWIASARVTKSFPSTLRISVTERRPAAVVQDGQSFMLLASDGTGLERLSHRGPWPVITGAAAPALGQRASQADPAAAAAGYLSASIRAQVDRIAVASDGSLMLSLTDGGKVNYGAPEELRQKADALAGIMNWAAQQHASIRTADLSAPSAPAAKVTNG